MTSAQQDARRVFSSLRTQAGGLAGQLDIDAHIRILDAVPEHRPYNELGQPVESLWQSVAAEHGEQGFDLFQRLTMARLIELFPERAPQRKYSEGVRSCFAHSHARILATLQDPAYANYRTRTDLLLKDLALCSLKMFPAGAQIVEPCSAFHRALLFRGGLRQALGVLALLWKSGGNVGWYQIHTHLGELEDFNPAGWDRCYLRIAEMLELHPEARGMWGGSWFYDPALEQVSPRLTYLRTVPQSGGASAFFSGVDLHGGALSKSETRTELYKQGKYMPTAYALIWPRAGLLEWARKMRSKSA